MTTEAQHPGYRFIKERDLPNLKAVVAILKSQNLDVYISGSAIMVPEYSDIDLLICDPRFTIVKVEDESAFEMSPQARAAIDHILKQDGVILKKKDKEYGGGYAGSVICGSRWEFRYNGTSIDISYAQEPGGLTREKIARLEAEMGGGDMGLEPEYERL
jgi:hypothetical protein